MPGFKGLIKQGAYAYISTPSATTCTAGDWVRLAGAFTNEILDDFKIQSDKLTYIGSSTCMYKIDLSLSLKSDTASTELSIGLYKNGVLQNNSVMTTLLKNLNELYNIKTIDVLELQPGDNIEIRIKSDRDASLTASTGNTSLMCFYGCERI